MTKHTLTLEDRYNLEDERPRNYGGRYIPTDEELALWKEGRQKQADHDETVSDMQTAGYPV